MVVLIGFLPVDVVGLVVGLRRLPLVLEKELLAPCTVTKNEPSTNSSISNNPNNNFISNLLMQACQTALISPFHAITLQFPFLDSQAVVLTIAPNQSTHCLGYPEAKIEK